MLQHTDISLLKYRFRPPEDIELRPVTEPHDLEKVNSVWSHSNLNSLALVQRMAKYNPNMGAFKKDDGTLVAWQFRYQNNIIKNRSVFR